MPFRLSEMTCNVIKEMPSRLYLHLYLNIGVHP
nr:MAG TPA: hypothetical protein [Caudoviricetes sp.]